MKKFKCMLLAVALSIVVAVVSFLVLYLVIQVLALLPEWLLYDVPLAFAVMILIASVLVQVDKLYKWLMRKSQK